METKEIKKRLASSEYDFLREDEHLGGNIILLTTGGSHSYGTNVESSDLDIRGVTLEREKEILGLSNFEQFENKATDTTIYGLRKMISLLMNCNPNVIELLGTKEEHLFILSKEGKLLRDNIDLFLSRKAVNSFGGYATAQLRRLQNALARDSYPQKEKEQHILNSINNQLSHLREHYSEFAEDGVKVYIDKSNKEDFEEEIFIDMNLKHYPLRDFKGISSEMSNIIKTYGELNHRNRKKDDLHLNKHAMHLVRLLTMGIEILQGEGVKTFRGTDREFLLEIREGKFQKEDGTFHQDFFDLVTSLEKELKYSADYTTLPSKPDFDKIEELVIEVNRGRLLR